MENPCNNNKNKCTITAVKPEGNGTAKQKWV
jgi:hypothetical protein